MEIASGIHRIDRVRGANSYLVLSSEGAAVIDTGLSGNGERIVEYARSAGVEPSAIRYIILTHSDPDHSGSAARLVRLTGAKTAIHEADAPRLAGKKRLKEVKGVVGVLFSVASPFMRFQPMDADILLKDGDRIAGLAVIHTPGHTEGSICLYREPEAMFVGDALRTDSSGMPHLPSASMTADMGRARESAKRIASYQYSLLLPGHGSPITRGASQVMADQFGLVKEARPNRLGQMLNSRGGLGKMRYD